MILKNNVLITTRYKRNKRNTYIHTLAAKLKKDDSHDTDNKHFDL